MTAETDVCVIGAGAAGLAAAACLRDAGRSFVLLEAAPLAGGRARTARDPLGVPWDLGCHWLHSAADNPFVPLADRLGVAYERGSGRVRRGLSMDGAAVAEPERLAAVQAVEDAFDAVRAAGRAGRDVAAAQVLPDAGRWAPLVRHWLTLMTAAEPEAISTRDFAAYEDGPDNWPVLDGYGALVLKAAGPLPVQLSCPVERIDRTGSRLRITTPAGTLSARAAVVAVSTAVMARGRIVFDPPLPADLMDAFQALPLGTAEKVAVAFDRDVFGSGRPRSLDVLDGSHRAASALIAPGGVHGALVHLAGTRAADLIAAGPGALENAAVEALCDAFGSGLKRHVRATVATTWAADPLIGGGYSCALPGAASARARLEAPVDERLFFAGEALGREAFSTCHGAHLSGQRAASAAMAALASTRGS